MKTTNYGPDHPFAVVRGRVAGTAAVGTATLETIELIVITAAITADTDDWNPAGLSTASVIRAEPDAPGWELSGIVAPADDRLLILENVTTDPLILIHDAISTAANRFLCPGDTDMTLGADTGVWLVYDLTSARWRVIGGSGGGVIPPGTYVLTIEGGQETVNARGTLGATETVDPTDGNIVTGTLDQDCTITVSAPTGSEGSTLEWWLTQSGGSWTPTFTPTGGTFQWDGGVTPTFPASGEVFRVVTERIPGTTNDLIGNLVGGSGGGASPLTTKGDLWGYSTTDDRVPVGTDGEVLTADSTDGLGVSYQTLENLGHYELLIAIGSSPLSPLENGDSTDFLYVWVP